MSPLAKMTDEAIMMTAATRDTARDWKAAMPKTIPPMILANPPMSRTRLEPTGGPCLRST